MRLAPGPLLNLGRYCDTGSSKDSKLSLTAAPMAKAVNVFAMENALVLIVSAPETLWDVQSSRRESRCTTPSAMVLTPSVESRTEAGMDSV